MLHVTSSLFSLASSLSGTASSPESLKENKGDVSYKLLLLSSLGLQLFTLCFILLAAYFVCFCAPKDNFAFLRQEPSAPAAA